MKENEQKIIISTGTLYIEKQVLKIRNRTINIGNIDNMDNYPLKRHPLTYGVTSWIKGLITLFVIVAIFHKSMSSLVVNLLFIIYLLILILLIYYNYNEHKKRFYELAIYTTRSEFMIQSNDRDFLYKLEDTIHNAMNQKYSSYTINIDKQEIKNNNNTNNTVNNNIKANNINNSTIGNNSVVNNTNNINYKINYKKIYNELKILEENCNENLDKIKEACENKDKPKLTKYLKGLKKQTINLIKTLGLTALTKLIENLL